jgi:RNA polymerase sigma-54 factor
MSLDMRIGQRLEQRQVLSLQTIQSLKILQLATADLQQLVEDELLQNPTLDTAEPEPEAEAPPELADKGAQPETETPTTESGESFDDVIEYLERNTDVNEFVSRSGQPQDGEEDPKTEAFNNLAAPGRTLADHLLEQLRLKGYDELDWPLLEHLVHSLDHRGYLEYPLEDVAKALQGRYTLAEVEWALHEIQKLEPRGVGARNLAECLLLQVSPQDPDYPRLRRLLTEFWDDVLRNRLPRIAREMDTSLEEVKLLIDLLGTLNPHPGTLYSDAPTQAVVPDVIVEEDENGRLVVRVTREMVPRLAINHAYLRMLQEKKHDKETAAFLKAKLNQARQLIEAIDQRQSTLERVANAILKRQEEFMRVGMTGLKPMKMQDIADELGIHHSTVWRAVYGKYMQTPQGVYAMNELFTGGLPSSESDVSREAVKLKVKEIIDGEDRKRPLSDMAIAKKLEELGIQASRRVVTKYREELGIADSRVRREH